MAKISKALPMVTTQNIDTKILEAKNNVRVLKRSQNITFSKCFPKNDSS